MNNIDKLIARIEELEKWKKQKEIQQLKFPLDEASKNVVPGLMGTGIGSATTQSILISTTPQTIHPPAQPSGTLSVVYKGVTYQLLYK